MGIRIYLSTFTDRVLIGYKNLVPESEINALLSYGTVKTDYYHMIRINRNLFNSLILDSGAFSKNFSKNMSEIEINGFIDYCKTIKDKLDFIINYDENFTKDGIGENLEYFYELKKEGIKTAPVVHDYDGDETEYYINNLDNDIIALGFSKQKTIEKIKAAAIKILQAEKKVHLLGIGNYSRLIELPFTYCDTSGWSLTNKYGYILHWNELSDRPKGKDKTEKIFFEDIYSEDYDNKNEIKVYKNRDNLLEMLNNDLKISENNLSGNDRNYYRGLVNIHYFLRLQEEVRKVHKAKFNVD